MTDSGATTTQRVTYRSFSGFFSSRENRMFGSTEIIALGVSCLVLLLVLASYLYFLVPARSRLATLQVERAQLQSNLQKSEKLVNQGRSTEQTVEKIAASLERFEQTGLLSADRGRMDLYEELNRLIIKNGLRNTSGPTYTPLEPIGAKSSPGKSVSTKWQSVYPGIAVAVTVEGQYQSVRHFIQDIERSKQFVVINEVELQRATENNAPASIGDAGSGSRGSLVSLQLNMATYFSRVEAGNESNQQ